jgi:hypothetical protein
MEERIDELEDKIDKEVFKTRDRLSNDIGQVKSRISEVERELGLTDIDNEDMPHHMDSTSKIGRISHLPKEERKEKVRKPLYRATIVWENFNEWSDFAPRGRVIKSGDLKKFLSAHTNEDLSWQQIYRVMEVFDEETSDIFKSEKSDELGKILIKELG